jgi:hypothetical protein
MSKVIKEHLDGYFMYEAPRLDVTSKDFKANVEEIVSALVQVRDEARELDCSPASDPSPWCPASPYYAPTDEASTSCYGNRSETINSSDQTPPCASAEVSRQMPVDDSGVTKVDKTWRPLWAKSVERTWKERSAEASAPKVRRAAQHAQSQEIEAATAKQQKKVR